MMMKISVASALALFVPSSMAADLNLRSAFQPLVASAATETYSARIVVGGLFQMVSDDEVNFISQQAMTAYNTAFGFDKAGQKIGSIKTHGFSTIPSDAFWWTDNSQDEEEAAFISADVDVFYYKTALGSASELGALHMQFEQDLCDRLQKSTYTNLAHSKDCSFSFLEKTGLDNEGPIETAYTQEGVTEAQLSLVGLNNELTESESDLLNKIVTNAHNEAFASSGLSLDFFQTVADFPVGDEGWINMYCTWCCPYDDDDPRCNNKTATIVVARVSAGGPIDQVKYMDAKIYHSHFENFVCFKLRTTGNPTFENVHDCRFNFVYHPVVKPAVVEQQVDELVVH